MVILVCEPTGGWTIVQTPVSFIVFRLALLYPGFYWSNTSVVLHSLFLDCQLCNGLSLLTFLFVYADEFDAYIVVSFVNATLVLSIGETVEEVTDSGFLGTTPTLGCSSLGDNALLQVKIIS